MYPKDLRALACSADDVLISSVRPSSQELCVPHEHERSNYSPFPPKRKAMPDASGRLIAR